MKDYNKYNATCPDEVELVKFKQGVLPEEDKKLLTEHLLLCDYCLMRLQFMPWETLEQMNSSLAKEKPLVEEAVISEDLMKAFELQRKVQAARPKSNPIQLDDFLKKNKLKEGQIWRTKHNNIILPSDEQEEYYSVSDLGSVPHLVLITNPLSEEIYKFGKKYHVIKVVTLDNNIHFSANDDIIISEEESPLGYSFMIQTWNQHEMLRENLDSWLGEISINPQSFLSSVTPQFSDLLDFLADLGRKEATGASFSFVGLIEQGNYSEPKMRYRAREFENTVYLSDPVDALRESLVMIFESEVAKNSLLKRWHQHFVNMLTPTVVNQEIQFEAGDEDSSENLKEKKYYFDTKLVCEKNRIEGAENEEEVTFYSDDPNFADKFVVLGTESGPTLIALFSDNDKSRNGNVSVLGLKDQKVTGLYEEKLFNVAELSKLFDDGEITEKIVHDSISSVNSYGLNAWHKITESKEIGEGLKEAILKHKRIK